MVNQENEFLHDVFGFSPKKKYLSNGEHRMSGGEKVSLWMIMLHYPVALLWSFTAYVVATTSCYTLWLLPVVITFFLIVLSSSSDLPILSPAEIV